MNKYSGLRIAVTDGDYKHTLGIVRKLGSIGIRPYVLTQKKWSLAGLSKFSSKEIILTESDDAKDLVRLLLDEKIQLLILVGTNSFKKIVPWKNHLEKENIKIITVDSVTQDVAFSKRATYKLAEEVGVPIPKTIYPNSFAEVEEVKGKLDFPCVIKGLYEVGGNIVDYAYSSDDLVIKYRTICEKNGITEHSGLPMIQEYIPGFGCAFFALYNNGICGPTFQHKRIREYPVTGGASSCAESYKSELLEKYGRILLDALRWHGVAMVEFKMGANGEPVLMEINPKFWGSTDLALEAGVNFPSALIDIFLGAEVRYSNNYKHPFRYHWPFDGDIQHVIDHPKSLPAFLKDLFSLSVRSNIKIYDPLPTALMMLSFFWAYILKFKRKIYV
jgi:predicted ATP-grasp superfamily ATP-dependent carboligase